MERFGANTHPAKNFQVKILQGIFWKGVPESCLFFLYFWEIMDSLQKMVEFTENCKFGMFDIIFQNLAGKGEERAEFSH